MLNEIQLKLLRERFPLFDPDACKAFFGDEQPEDGQFLIQGQGRFPGIRMANGVKWFADRSNRPLGEPNARGERPPMKAKAPTGMRHLLVDDTSAPEILVVEGEGDGVALASVGQRGVAVVGGTKALLSSRGEARVRRENVFRDKRVRILYDGDEAGQAGAKRAAEAILEASAAQVAIVEPPWEPSQDVEDWLASFESRERAFGELADLLSRARWLTESDLADELAAPEPVPTQSARVDVEGLDRPILVCTTWDPEAREAKLAVFAPSALLDHAESLYSGQPPPLGDDWTWRSFDEFNVGGTTYVPDLTGDYARHLRGGTLILAPPPFEGSDTPDQLFRDVEAFVRRWVVLPDDRLYTVATAWALLTWRVHDAELPAMPILRITGDSGTGKGRVIAVLSQLCWRSYHLATTPDNNHYLVKQHGDVTQFFDELHLDRGRSRDAQERLIDVFNYGFERGKEVSRVVEGELRAFPVFGSRVLIGYGVDEHEAIARRTVAIRMEPGVSVPPEMSVAILPPEFYEAAVRLRARLLAWRGREHLGDLRTAQALHHDLVKRAGRELAPTFWPLVAMVPPAMTRELETVFEIAEERRGTFEKVRKTDLTTHLLSVVAEIIRVGNAHEQADGRSWVVPTREIVEWSRDPRVTVTSVPQKLGENGVGLEHGEFRVAGSGSRPMGFKVPKESAAMRATFERHGVEWPEASDTKRAA